MEEVGQQSLRRELLKRSAEHRAALEDDLNALSDRTEKVITNAIIIGGGLAVSYLLARKFFKSKKQKKRTKRSSGREEAITYVEQPEQERSEFSVVLSEVGSAVASQVLAFLLAMAKEKLVEYLSEQSESKNSKTEE